MAKTKTAKRAAARKRSPAKTKISAKKKSATTPGTTRKGTTAIATISAPEITGEPTDMVLMLGRLAMADVDPAKLKEMVEVVREVRAIQAKAAFDSAFARMQGEFPIIPRHGVIMRKDGVTVQSRYPLMEDIQAAILPVLARHGFSLSQRTEWPNKEPGEQRMMRIVGILSHEEGHAKESSFLTVADETGSKNSVQALRSAISYGRRSTTFDVLNLTSRGEDDDGQRAGELEKKNVKKTRSRYQNMAPPGTINAAAIKQLMAAMKSHNVRRVDFQKYLKDTFGYVTLSLVLNSQFTRVLEWLQSPDDGQPPAAVEGEVV